MAYGSGSSGNNAPSNAPFVVQALNALLSAERVLAINLPLQLTDGGANGNITIDFPNQAANLALAGPAAGAAAAPTFRALVDDDIPAALTLVGGSANNMPIGAITPNSSAFTTISATGLVDISAAGAGQIQFPAVQNPSAGANTLDDYEEGTWTPTDASGAGLGFTSASGTYEKIGRQVTARYEVTYPVTADAAMQQSADYLLPRPPQPKLDKDLCR